MKTIYTFLILFLIAICGCNNNTEIPNPDVLVIGHGGSGFQSIYPINSIESIINAVEKNIDGVEIDVQLTKDNVFVAYHDSEMSRSSNLSGEIYQKNWSEIEGGEYKFAIHGGYKIATLEDIFVALQPYADKKIFLDLKAFNPDRTPEHINQYINNLVTLIDKYNYRDRVVLELKNESFIFEVITQAEDIPVLFFSTFQRLIDLTDSVDINGWIHEMDEVTPEQLETARDRNLCVTVFDVQTRRETRDAIDKGFCGIYADKIDYLLQQLGR